MPPSGKAIFAAVARRIWASGWMAPKRDTQSDPGIPSFCLDLQLEKPRPAAPRASASRSGFGAAPTSRIVSHGSPRRRQRRAHVPTPMALSLVMERCDLCYKVEADKFLPPRGLLFSTPRRTGVAKRR
jgi:hypothetical protein